MPFDGIEDKVLARTKLIEALRNEMPEGFEWDFTFFYERHNCGCTGCAVGLAYKMGMIKSPKAWLALSKAIGLTYAQGSRIFTNGGGYYRDFFGVTPNMVADEIEKIFK